jgi:hypothetical protein
MELGYHLVDGVSPIQRPKISGGTAIYDDRKFLLVWQLRGSCIYQSLPTVWSQTERPPGKVSCSDPTR